MTEPTATTLFGVKYSTLIAGFFGSVVALTFAKELPLLRLLLAVFTGTVTAMYASPIVSYYLGVPAALDNGVAFLVGLLAMISIPVLFSAVEQLKEATIENLKRRLG